MDVVRFFSIFAVLLQTCTSHEIEFSGQQMITYDVTERQFSKEKFRITFRFKTINPFGLIFYSKGTQGDYIAIELVDGSLRYQADPGSTSNINSKQELTAGHDLSNNVWHSVDITWNRNKVNISIDSKVLKSNSFESASFTKLDLDDRVFVGGVFDDTKIDADLGFMARHYTGCLANLLFDDINILYNAKYNRKYFTSYGDMKYNCEEFQYAPVSFPDYKSIIKIPTYIDKSLSLQLSFRTYIAESMLLSKISNDSKIFLEIRGGKLVLRVQCSKITPIMLEIGSNINDGNWHKINVTVSSNMASIGIDNIKPLEYKHPDLKKVLYPAQYITLGGGADNILRGFEGCVYRITVDGTFIDARLLDKNVIEGALIDKCIAMNKCWPNPCQNGGLCRNTGTDFQCDCTQTLYSGKVCKDPIVKTTCEEYKSVGLNEDSYCQVDPDGTGPLQSFEVICKVTEKGPASTIIPVENNLKRIKVDESASLRGKKYFTQMNYKISMEKIFSLINISSHCRQFVRYECKNSPLLNSPRGPAHVSWVNRKGVVENYWGGAPRGSDKCACGVTKTCTDSSKYCNCDMADDFWREDSGFLTDKDALPVTLIQFDATAANSYFTVGNLECQSKNAVTSTPKPHSNDALKACRSLIEKTTTTAAAKSTASFTTKLPQTERIMTKIATNSKDAMTKLSTMLKTKHVATVSVKSNEKNNYGNTSNASTNPNKNHDGVTISMSILAVIVISASIVLVWAIIAVIVIVRRRRRDSKRDEHPEREHENDEGTEMCILFRQTKREVPRPTIELRRDSYDSYDSVPTPALEYTQDTGFRQPITTHITLDYARAKKKKNGGSAYFCS